MNIALDTTNATQLIAGTLAEFAATLRYEDIPTDIRERAKHLMLDGIGIAYASTHYDFAHRSLAAVTELGQGDSDVIGLSAKLSLRDAVLMNGILVHGLDFDDTHGPGIIHATASCLPTALGVAAHLGISGRELLTAYVLGMEVATRLGSVAKGGFHQVGFHPTGLVGAFACALIAGRLQGHNAAQLAMAQGIALSTASGSMEFLQDGAWTKRMHPGWAGVAGVTSATLARHGFIGPKAVYEGRFGLFKSHLGPLEEACDYALATEGLGRHWEIDNVSVKPLPACHFTHACADAAVLIGQQPGFDLQQIAHIKALVPAGVIKTVCEPEQYKRQPQNTYDAQFSIPYAVASGLVRGRFGLSEIDPAAIGDKEVLRVANLVEYAADPDSTFPRHYTGEVIVTLRDGTVLRHREAINRGGCDRPLANGDIVEKFRENLALVASSARAEEVLQAVLTLDNAVSAKAVSSALAARA
ncbi:MmgE/PrpD family protein [Stutzerimonas stutzeri]|uniref:MmgE/PrpD family protein n=1 Tax=Stutzerimonas stutzeri TaxID=316 RepID=A0A6I6LWD0_STUST|nr:MmgE/PrpD family protein [Stutzerimonas stutzeri]QGZ30962.1 MmgE/PrpD family protein [Stutzerimonas stutzeri]